MSKRTDLLPLRGANPGKIRELLDVLRLFRTEAPAAAADQWQRLFQDGRFDKRLSAAQEAASPRLAQMKARMGAVRMQMLRHQIVGDLESFISNRANDFKEIVFRSSLDDDLLHQFNTINSARAWFSRESVLMRSGRMKGEEIPQEIRKLARSIMREVLSRHRRPCFHRMPEDCSARGSGPPGPGATAPGSRRSGAFLPPRSAGC